MRRAFAVVIVFAVMRGSPLAAADQQPQSKTRVAAHAVAQELKRYATDAKHLAVAPLHWDEHSWMRFAEGLGAVGTVYAADPDLYDAVQRNRSSFTNDFAKTITPFGGRRIEYISVAMILLGSAQHDVTMRDAGRDSLEAEIFAGGFVTPVLKRTFGRARPRQDEGARSFHPFDVHYESFPSGHATNAFAFASAVAAHYDGWVVPTIVYSLATGVAMSRVNDRHHFPSDVLAGALIGRAVARSITSRHAASPSRITLSPIIVKDGFGFTIRIGS